MATAPLLPNWIPPSTSTNSSGGRGDINSSSKSARERTLNVSAFGNPLPIIYGVDRVGALHSLIEMVGSTLYLRPIWAMGEVSNINKVWLDDDEDKPLSAAHCVNYRGTVGQEVDPWLASAIDGYADSLDVDINGQRVSAAYSVLKVPASATSFPNVTAEIQGRKVYDPRDTRQRLEFPKTWTWSSNPALCLADFIYLSLKCPTYNLVQAANFCDELTQRPDGSVNRRHTLNLALINRQTPWQWITTLAQYAQCLVFPYLDGLMLVPDAAVSQYSGVITDDDVKKINSMNTTSMLNAPTSITLFYTDKSRTPWTERSTRIAWPEVDTGELPYRDSEISLPGINNVQEAQAMACKRLEALNCDLELTTTHHDDGLLLKEGGVYVLNLESAQLINKAMRIIGKTPIDNGDWRIVWQEYQPAVYTQTLESVDEWLDNTALPSPFDVPQVINIVMQEDIYKLQTGWWASRISATWSMPTDYGYNVTYEIKVLDMAGASVFNAITYTPNVVTPPLAESYIDDAGVRIYLSYTLQVRAVSSSVAQVGEWAEATLTLDGKRWPPSNVPMFNAFERQGRVFASWTPATDADIIGYRWGFVQTNESWDHSSFSLINSIDSLRDETEVIPAGSWDLLIRAEDSVGNLSEEATRTPIIVTLDDDAYRAGTHDFTIDEVLIMENLYFASLFQESKRILRSSSSTAWNDLYTDSINDYTNSLLSYSMSASYFRTIDYDFGVQISAQAKALLSHKVYQGNGTPELLTSLDATTYASWASMAAKTLLQYTAIEASATPDSVIEITIPKSNVTLDATVRTEKGTVITDNLGNATIVLSEPMLEFRSAPRLVAEGYVNVYFDNVQMGVSGVNGSTSFDVYTQLATSGLAAENTTVYWEVTGI